MKGTFTPSSIIPAGSWCAIYVTPDEKTVLFPLVCWAMGVVEQENGVVRVGIIKGMISDESKIVAADSIPGFKGYDVSQEDFEIEMENLMN
jgi:signal transduction histidine kinase